MSKTKIQWTASDDGGPGETWNPTVGCTRVSSGCNHCYAFELHDKRHIAWKRGRYETAPAQYHQPFSRVQLLPERLRDPYHWKRPRRVFVDSMADLFHPDVPSSFILDVWLTMADNPRHTFQVLTKRPERMAAWCRETFAAAPSLTSLPNVWLGTSVEDQTAADERIPHLLDTPAAIRFLSCEPLLAPVDLDEWLWDEPDRDCSAGLNWVIIGGESGKHARGMSLVWAGELVAQCRAAGVAVFVKQLGSEQAFYLHLKDRHGGDMSEWRDVVPSLAVREWPHVPLMEAAL